MAKTRPVQDPTPTTAPSAEPPSSANGESELPPKLDSGPERISAMLDAATPYLGGKKLPMAKLLAEPSLGLILETFERTGDGAKAARALETLARLPDPIQEPERPEEPETEDPRTEAQKNAEALSELLGKPAPSAPQVERATQLGPDALLPDTPEKQGDEPAVRVTQPGIDLGGIRHKIGVTDYRQVVGFCLSTSNYVPHSLVSNPEWFERVSAKMRQLLSNDLWVEAAVNGLLRESRKDAWANVRLGNAVLVLAAWRAMSETLAPFPVNLGGEWA